MHVTVKVNDINSFNNALRQLKIKAQKEGRTNKMREQRYHLSPSQLKKMKNEMKRRKSIRAKKNRNNNSGYNINKISDIISQISHKGLNKPKTEKVES